jgi:hypothetical protein
MRTLRTSRPFHADVWRFGKLTDRSVSTSLVLYLIIAPPVPYHADLSRVLVNLGYYARRMSTSRLLILGLVKWAQPVHGYDVKRELENWQVEQWATIAPGSIYHGLRKLSQDGLLEEVATERVGSRPARTNVA